MNIKICRTNDPSCFTFKINQLGNYFVNSQNDLQQNKDKFRQFNNLIDNPLLVDVS